MIFPSAQQSPWPGHTPTAQKGYRCETCEADPNSIGMTMPRPATRTGPTRPGVRLLRQIIESINWTLKGQITLERQRECTRPGVVARIATRLLALTAVGRHNETHHHRPARTLTPYDH